jgi:hypothetical protein
MKSKSVLDFEGGFQFIHSVNDKWKRVAGKLTARALSHIGPHPESMRKAATPTAHGVDDGSGAIAR